MNKTNNIQDHHQPPPPSTTPQQRQQQQEEEQHIINLRQLCRVCQDFVSKNMYNMTNIWPTYSSIVVRIKLVSTLYNLYNIEKRKDTVAAVVNTSLPSWEGHAAGSDCKICSLVSTKRRGGHKAKKKSWKIEKWYSLLDKEVDWKYGADYWPRRHPYCHPSGTYFKYKRFANVQYVITSDVHLMSTYLLGLTWKTYLGKSNVMGDVLYVPKPYISHGLSNAHQ